MDEDDEFYREMERARANDHLRSGADTLVRFPPPVGETETCSHATEINCVGICVRCLARRQAETEREQTAMAAECKRILQACKLDGEISKGNRTWLMAHGYNLSVEGLEQRFAAETNGTGNTRRRRDDR